MYISIRWEDKFISLQNLISAILKPTRNYISLNTNNWINNNLTLELVWVRSMKPPKPLTRWRLNSVLRRKILNKPLKKQKPYSECWRSSKRMLNKSKLKSMLSQWSVRSKLMILLHKKQKQKDSWLQPFLPKKEPKLLLTHWTPQVWMKWSPTRNLNRFWKSLLMPLLFTST